MISLKEKLPELNKPPEKDAPLSRRMKIALMRAAVRAVTFSGDNLGPQGKHALHDRNYHNSAVRYIEEVNPTLEAIQEARSGSRQKGRHRGSTAIGSLPQTASIAKNPNYLYTHPDTKYSHVPGKPYQ